MGAIKLPSGTRATLDTLAGSGGLVEGRIYWISDEDRLAIATGTTTYALYLRDDELIFNVPFVLSGGDSVLTTGVKADVKIDFPAVILGWDLLGDTTGSVTVDLWKDTYANYPPTDADSITASAPPTMSGAVKAQSSTLTGWTTAVASGDIIRLNLDSVATLTRLTLNLRMRRDG